ncbi:MAG: hypothetical protein ABI240_12875 [Sphingomonas sp.]
MSLFLRGASLAGVTVMFAVAFTLLLRSPPDNVIPGEFQGTWLDQGAECGDVDAQLRITATTINYDRLSYKAFGLAKKEKDAVVLTGEAYPDGGAKREEVGLRMDVNRTRLVIASPDLAGQGPFVRCSAGDGEGS